MLIIELHIPPHTPFSSNNSILISVDNSDFTLFFLKLPFMIVLELKIMLQDLISKVFVKFSYVFLKFSKTSASSSLSLLRHKLQTFSASM